MDVVRVAMEEDRVDREGWMDGSDIAKVNSIDKKTGGVCVWCK